MSLTNGSFTDLAYYTLYFINGNAVINKKAMGCKLQNKQFKP